MLVLAPLVIMGLNSMKLEEYRSRPHITLLRCILYYVDSPCHSSIKSIFVSFVSTPSGIPTPQQKSAKGDRGDPVPERASREVVPVNPILPDNQLGMSDFEDTAVETPTPPRKRLMRSRSKSSQVFVEDGNQQKCDKPKDGKQKDDKQQTAPKAKATATAAKTKPRKKEVATASTRDARDAKSKVPPAGQEKADEGKKGESKTPPARTEKADESKKDKKGEPKAPPPRKEKADEGKKGEKTIKGSEKNKPAADADVADAGKQGDQALLHTLQRADTQEVEDQVAKRNAYKARKQRFYNSLTSVDLKTFTSRSKSQVVQPPKTCAITSDNDHRLPPRSKVTRGSSQES